MFRKLFYKIRSRWATRDEKNNDWEYVTAGSDTETIDCVRVTRAAIWKILLSWPEKLYPEVELLFKAIFRMQMGRFEFEWMFPDTHNCRNNIANMMDMLPVKTLSEINIKFHDFDPILQDLMLEKNEELIIKATRKWAFKALRSTSM